MKAPVTYNFAQVPSVGTERSVFDRSFAHKTTFNEGLLVPILTDEALPGDTFKVSVTALVRLLSPLHQALMDNMYCDIHFYAILCRLVWEHWVNFCGEREPVDLGQPNPWGNDYLIPQVELASGSETIPEMHLFDYMGLPTHAMGAQGMKFSALFGRAYNLTWNTWYRDQNLQSSVEVETGDGPEVSGEGLSLLDDRYKLLPRGKRHDYFTSALPWPQKGPGVELPLGTTAPVLGNGLSLGLTNGTTSMGIFPPTTGAGGILDDTGAYNVSVGTTVPSTPYHPVADEKALGVVQDGAYSGLITDLTQALAVTINTLREAFQLQRLLERDARGGTRYIEWIKSQFNVISPDFRHQRPEYLGGGSVRINQHVINQTSAAGSTGYLGTLAAFSVGSGQAGFTHSFTEHCIVLGLLSVRADMTYQQGINRMWSRRTRVDHYLPVLAHLGEQAILNKEIVAVGLSTDNDVWGYQERWAEYRYKPSMITGVLRSTATQPLDTWHLAQYFTDGGTPPVSEVPPLNEDFIKEAPPIERVVVVQNQPHFILDSLIQMHCARPMPVYSVPGNVDHH